MLLIDNAGHLLIWQKVTSSAIPPPPKHHLLYEVEQYTGISKYILYCYAEPSKFSLKMSVSS